MYNFPDWIGWIQTTEKLLGGLILLIFGIVVTVKGRIHIRGSRYLTGLLARLIGLVAAIVSLLLLLSLAAD